MILITIVVSVLILLLETIPSLRQLFPPANNITTVPPYELFSYSLMETMPVKWLIVLDVLTTAILTLDFIARLVLTLNKLKFLCKAISIIDIISIVPVWVGLMIGIYMTQTGNINEVINVLRYVALLRVLRIFRFSHIALHNKQLRIFSLALRSTWKELLILVSTVLMYACLFGILAYYTEAFFGGYQMTGFEGVYWAIISMTTVGYGDIYLITNAGRLVAVLCCMVGIIVIAMTTTILVNTFFTVYQTVEKIERLETMKQGKTSGLKQVN